MDGGERRHEGPAALNSALERPSADGRARPLEELFPPRGDGGVHDLMQETWRAQAHFGTPLAACLQLRPDLLGVDALQPTDAAALTNLLSTGARDIVAAGEPQAMAGMPRQSVDLQVNVGRLHGSFVVIAIQDATGAELFAHEKNGGFSVWRPRRHLALSRVLH